MDAISNFFRQLWKRRVVQFGALYLGAAWVLLQAAIAIESTMKLPDWVDQTTLVLLVIGFPLALILAWAQETQAGARSSNNTETAMDESNAGSPAISRNAVGIASKPSIAVLPFVNMSDDKDYFADGMTEDIITGLSLSGHLSVTSRTSMFAYKEQSIDVRKVGHELGATYVVDGSVRPMGERLRITVQLIRAETGDHLWAEKYDRPAEQIFDIQDEVIASVTSAVGAIVTKAESLRASKLTPSSLSAWEAVQRASFYRGAMGNSEEETNKSIEELRAAVRDAPDYAYAHSMLAWISQYKVINGLTDTPEEDAKEAEKHLEIGLALAPDDSYNLNICSGAVGYMSQFDRSIELCQRALSIDPHFADPYFNLGNAYAHLGRFHEAEEAFDTVERMAPNGPMSRYYDWYRAQLCQFEGKWEEAEQLIRSTIEKAPAYTGPYIQLALVLRALGRYPEAAKEFARALRINPNLTMMRFAHPMQPLDRDFSKKRSEDFVELWQQHESKP